MQGEKRIISKWRARGCPLLLMVIVILTTGIGALGGSVLGAGSGHAVAGNNGASGLFIGALVGGTAGVALGVRLAAVIGALPGSPRPVGGAFAGGLLGFFCAAAIATRHIHTAWIPITSTLLPGIGAAVGSAIAGKIRSGD